MHIPPPVSYRCRAAAATPILVFTGIVGMSVVFFFLFTLPRWTKSSGEKNDAPAAAAAVSKPVPAAPGPGGKPAAKPNTPKPPVVYATPQLLLDAVAVPLRLGNLDAAMKIVGKEQGQSPQANFLRHVLSTAGYRVPDEPAAAWARLGQSGQTQRYTLAIAAAVEGTPPPAGFPWFDLDRDPKSGWKVTKIGHPEALIHQVTAALRAKSLVLDENEVRSESDPIARATEFLSGILSHDFRAARSLTDETKVTHEKLAGLCIVFEEGEYRLVEDRPVFVTSEKNDTATAILKVRSDKLNTASELGLVLRKLPGRGWTVEDLNFDSMLNSYVQATDAGSVFYSPIKSSPQGGDSLVLYFEFGRSEITTRARRQLEIVAGLLKSDPVRKLRISGHADAIGTDDFNLRLSQSRALAVAACLKDLGTAPGQVITVGFGATAPLDQNKRDDGKDNPEGRSRNRRTEVFLDFGE